MSKVLKTISKVLMAIGLILIVIALYFAIKSNILNALGYGILGAIICAISKILMRFIEFFTK